MPTFSFNFEIVGDYQIEADSKAEAEAQFEALSTVAIVQGSGSLDFDLINVEQCKEA